MNNNVNALLYAWSISLRGSIGRVGAAIQAPRYPANPVGVGHWSTDAVALRHVAMAGTARQYWTFTDFFEKSSQLNVCVALCCVG